MGGLLKRLQVGILATLRVVGRLAAIAPEPPRATGGYGLACRGALILLFLVGLLLALWLPGPGLVIMIVATVALLQFFVLQYQGTLTKRSTILWLGVVTVVCSAIVALVWRRWAGRDGSGGAAGTDGDVMVLAALLVGLAGLSLVRSLFTTIFGPHHPESALPEPGDKPPLWFWIGAVGPETATIVARLDDGLDADSVVVVYRADDSGPESELCSETKIVSEHRLARIKLEGLVPNLRYELRVEARKGAETVDYVRGCFATFPPHGHPATVQLAFGSCMSTGSRGAVFDTIANTSPKPQLFMVTGDLHYENITARNAERFLAAYDKVHASFPQRRLYNSMPMAYVWDDHDFGDNNSGHDSPSKHAAQLAYRLAVPSYLAQSSSSDQGGAINQEFTIGRVRVVVTDNRSERGEIPGHMLSRVQEQWLIDCITDPTWPVVLWVSSTPWISSNGSSDNWGAYIDQRRRIADAIGARSANLVMVSGDAHMLAIDDGTNSDYTSATPTSLTHHGFPVLQAAALDRLGSAKGGPFSHGKFAGAGHFGLVTVDDRGDEIEVTLSARSWTGSEIINHSFMIATEASGGTDDHSPVLRL